MKVKIQTEFNTSAKESWHLVKQSKTLIYVCKGLLSFEGCEHFPEQWKENTCINTRLRLFGLIPMWKHSLWFHTISEPSMTIATQEKGGLVNVWNHKIKVEEKDDTHCTYSDTVEIKAGVFTPAVWLFANVLYRYRQQRWKRLLPEA